MTPVEKVQIRLFGSPQILWCGQPVVVPRSQQRALLYRLATTLEPVAREHLCFLFWPDINDAAARRQLTQALSHLRRALPNPDSLETSKEQVRLNPTRVWVDSAVFSWSYTSQHKTIAQLKSTIDLYAGPFLDGVALPNAPEFEHWQQTERHRYEQRYLDALMTLLVESSVQGDNPESIQYARRYLAVDNLAEAVHRRLIDLYVASGERGAAIRQFEECSAILARELGVEPLPETRIAYEAALTMSAAPVQQQTSSLAWTTLASMEIPLVGRDSSLAQLERCFVRVSQGQGGVALIAGEAGIGKSRLLQEFANTHMNQALVLAGACQPGGLGLPYQPLLQALRSGLGQLDEQVALEPIWLAELSRVLPELHARYPNLPPLLQSDPTQARTRLFAALVHLLFGFTKRQNPLLLFLDDLHWADSTTLEWLAYLGMQLRTQRLLVIGTYRKEEPDAVLALRHALQRADVLVDIELVGLDTAAVQQILDYAQTSATNRLAVAQQLQRVTAGNTFFLLEVIRSFLEAHQPLDELRPLETLPIPQTVSEMVAVRLNRLNSVARQLLEAASVLGLAFPYELVQRISGRTEMEAIDGLDELVGRYLVSEAGDGYQFHHEIIRRVVYGGLSHWRRRLLHRRSAEALEVLHSADLDPVSAQLAGHYAAAQLPGLAIGFYQRAARVALRTFAHIEAVKLLTQGIQLLQSLPETSARHRQELELQIMLGSSLIVTHGFAAVEMKQAYERAWQLAQQVTDAPGLFSALWGIWSFYNTQGQMRPAIEVGWQLWELAKSEQNADHMLGACRALGSALFHAGDLLPAREYQERGLALYDPPQHHQSHILRYGADSAVVCLSSLTLTLWILGYPDQAYACYQKTRALIEQLAHPFSRAFALNYLVWFHHFRLDGKQARMYAEMTIALCEQHGFQQLRAMALILHGWAMADQGEVADGIEQLQRGLQSWRATSSIIGSIYWRYLLADVYGKCNQPAQGLALLAEAIAEVEGRGERRGEPELHRLRGELRQMQGAPEAEVEAAFQQALTAARYQAAKSFELRAAISMARLWQQQGKLAQARAILSPIIDWFTEGLDAPDLQTAKDLLARLA